MNSPLFDSIYYYVLLYLTTTPCIFALSLVFTVFPNHDVNKCYRQARYAIATGLLLASALCFIHWYFHPREQSFYYSVAISLGALYPALVLFIMAFSSIIRQEDIRPEHLERNFIPAIAGIILLWGGGFGGSTIRITMLVVVSTVFFAETIILCRLMRKSLNRQTRTQKQQPSANAFIQWLQRSMYWGIAIGVTGVAVMMVSKKVALLLLSGFAIYPCYLFVSLLNYAMHFEKEAQEQQPSALSRQQKKNRKIETDIRQWISEKRYMKSQLTLNDVAHQLHTNRTYLSQYINMELNMPFGSWLSQLRLNEAKQMLAENASLSITEAALACGFSSVSNFSHLFTALEGMTPQQWRETQGNKEQP